MTGSSVYETDTGCVYRDPGGVYAVWLRAGPKSNYPASTHKTLALACSALDRLERACKDCDALPDPDADPYCSNCYGDIVIKRKKWAVARNPKEKSDAEQG